MWNKIKNIALGVLGVAVAILLAVLGRRGDVFHQRNRVSNAGGHLDEAEDRTEEVRDRLTDSRDAIGRSRDSHKQLESTTRTAGDILKAIRERGPIVENGDNSTG